MSDKPYTILATDSGIGGISVLAEVAAMLKNASPWPEVDLIYVNLWPSATVSYASYPTLDARATVFNRAMLALAGFNPDAIAIACNTLSVLYPRTDFAARSFPPVMDIVEDGVSAMEEALREPGTAAVIFGTPTTIEAGAHRKALLERGFAPERLVEGPCESLAGKIEANPFGHDTKAAIRGFCEDAAKHLPSDIGRVYAALCCTHFGYCEEAFSEGLQEASGRETVVLNPNSRMARRIVAAGGEPGGAARLRIRVISKVIWSESQLDVFAELLRDVSPETVEALRNYELLPDLYDIS